MPDAVRDSDECAGATNTLSTMDTDGLRAMARESQLELLRLRPQLASAELERVKLARRVASLVAERDTYLHELTQASQQLAAEACRGFAVA